MNTRKAVAGFPGSIQLDGLENAWYWSPAPGIDFAGALSADGRRLLQLRAADSYDQKLAVAVLGFARDHEEFMFAANPSIGSTEGFVPPEGFEFDTVAATSPEVHRFYAYENPELMPLVRVVFPAYACEFSGEESESEAITRYKMLGKSRLLARDPVPFLKMRYANTRTKARSTNPGRGFTEERNLQLELRDMDGAPDSFVEFENRHAKVWRVEWHGAWYVGEWDTQGGAPQEIGLDELLTFAAARLRD
ncbi:hypothetical protein AB0I66_38895 [Streptomyces sp. NPDC050439]|uniref:hypothetical protein n=1 Tax=unclassified Streptomyces TaxID=2593676 RepID=UPI0034280206